MRESLLQFLVCPKCRGDLNVTSIIERNEDRLNEATLGCTNCHTEYPVVRGIPRFVPNDNYAAGFGVQWNKHARTQYDSYTGLRISEDRFFRETRWPRDLAGQLVLEAGSGSGRFTEIAASTGATVVSMDYSHAVEANYASNGLRPNVLIVQANLYEMPFRAGTFDKVFCFGVLQHTPRVRDSFLALIQMLRQGGEIAVDVYPKSLSSMVLHSKYLARLFTRRMSPELLYALCRRWVDALWPVATVLRKIPRLGPSLNWRLMVADYSNFGLTDELLREWAYLDTFDMLGPRYDSPQTLTTVRRWFSEARLVDVDVQYGYNGIEGRGRKT